jgi:thiamine-monophosphate kinase
MGRLRNFKRTISDIGEFGVIRELMRGLPTEGPGLVRGIGDDTSVLSRGRGKMLVTTDLLQERIHFDRRWSPWDHVGEKSLQINLSDIAAMGGRPRYFWLTLGLPQNFPLKDLRKFRMGLNRAARSSGVLCAGGDTNRSQMGVTVSITLLGEAGKKIVYRQGARVGDDIYVTGNPGEAALGLICFKKNKAQVREAIRFCRRHTSPEARVLAGQRLAELGVHAMIDVSDGIAADLGHILQASNIAAEIHLESLRPNKKFQHLSDQLGVKWSDLVLAGGEDYELLFCASARLKEKIQRLSQSLNLPITKIGRIITGRGLRCYDGNGKVMKLDRLGYNHFA